MKLNLQVTPMKSIDSPTQSAPRARPEHHNIIHHQSALFQNFLLSLSLSLFSPVSFSVVCSTIVRSQFSEMDSSDSTSPSKPKPKATLPPRRGEIKRNILNKLIKSTKTAAAAAGRLVRTGGEERTCLSSASTTPKETPSGYTSESVCD